MTNSETSLPLPPLTGDYKLDLAHTRIGFSARHAMVSKVRGAVQRVRRLCLPRCARTRQLPRRDHHQSRQHRYPQRRTATTTCGATTSWP